MDGAGATLPHRLLNRRSPLRPSRGGLFPGERGRRRKIAVHIETGLQAGWRTGRFNAARAATTETLPRPPRHPAATRWAERDGRRRASMGCASKLLERMHSESHHLRRGRRAARHGPGARAGSRAGGGAGPGRRRPRPGSTLYAGSRCGCGSGTASERHVRRGRAGRGSGTAGFGRVRRGSGSAPRAAPAELSFPGRRRRRLSGRISAPSGRRGLPPPRRGATYRHRGPRSRRRGRNDFRVRRATAGVNQ
jgi:hypothetical protein